MIQRFIRLFFFVFITFHFKMKFFSDNFLFLLPKMFLKYKQWMIHNFVHEFFISETSVSRSHLIWINNFFLFRRFIIFILLIKNDLSFDHWIASTKNTKVIMPFCQVETSRMVCSCSSSSSFELFSNKRFWTISRSNQCHIYKLLPATRSWNEGTKNIFLNRHYY